MTWGVRCSRNARKNADLSYFKRRSNHSATLAGVGISIRLAEGVSPRDLSWGRIFDGGDGKIQRYITFMGYKLMAKLKNQLSGTPQGRPLCWPFIDSHAQQGIFSVTGGGWRIIVGGRR